MISIIVVLVIVAIVVLLRLGSAAKGIIPVTAEAALKMSRDSGVIVLDVRTPQEFREGHIKGAMLIPMAELENRIGELLPLKNHQFLVYCRAGRRSAAASRVLKKNGFSRIANLQGGICAWVGSGYSIVKGK